MYLIKDGQLLQTAPASLENVTNNDLRNWGVRILNFCDALQGLALGTRSKDLQITACIQRF